MKIDEFKIFEGRNIYSHRKCIKMCIDLEGYRDIPTKNIDGFNEALLKTMPALDEHRCGIDEEHGFRKRLQEGTYLAHVCEHIIIAIQNGLGMDVSYGKSREIKGNKYYVIYEYIYSNTAVEIGKIAVNLINCFINKKSFDFNAAIRSLKEKLRLEELGPSTLSIVEEAKKRGIPIMRMGEGSMFQLGYGRNSKIIEATISNDTKCIPVDIACNKLMTKEILYNQHLPVADGYKIRNSLDLLFKAEKLGYPIVMKPTFGNQGKGVFVNIKNEKEALKAYNILSKDYDDVIIEENIIGKDYRVCVVDGKVVAAAERIPPYVVGDGVSTVNELIAILNSDSLRGEGHEKPLTKVKINNELESHIAKSGYNLNMILPKGEKLILRENANLSTGGKAIDCTDIICKENINICERAAKAIGLDVCGIDICCLDISQSIDKEGAILEVNAAPGIRMHHYPSEGKSRNVAGAIVDMLFKNTSPNIPLVSITGTNGKTTTTRLIGHVLSKAGYNVGMTTTGGIYINDKCISKGDTTGYYSARTVLTNNEINAAVLETARGGIIRKGLAYDMADVAVITNITEDHLGLDDVETMEDLAYVKALVGEAVKDEGYAVLNADDPVSMSIIDRIKSNIIIFSRDRNNHILRQNLKKGGYGVYTNGGMICIEKDDSMIPIVKISDIKITIGGRLEYNIENAMAACAALIGLNIDYSIISNGLRSFYCDEEFNPGRFNMYKVNGALVVLDYGHNIDGYKAVLNGAKNIQHNRLVGVIGVPGDRTDSSVEEVGKISGENFDYVYIKEDKDRRGRKMGEIASILEKGVLTSSIDRKKIEIVLDEVEALEKAIDNARSGDLIITFFEEYEPLVQLIKEKIDSYTNQSEQQPAAIV
ncbi:cyanophycin synthetase [Clostridiaceae bacterium UIB06]|uniref:Cyanophycin synthetase n=1 Tax=Clostridium thailandense TaxID=2794346 RepID=A0A949TKX0_9CLOT|nr:cyanophycin synthetase [Clostridium thailandense]MBV7272372.1 cyanophycin synthetase [Clostridium thailandense]MCH5135915.1 cyanophycin synthetase [Clostridiaceae bacterium UIB06]